VTPVTPLYAAAYFAGVIACASLVVARADEDDERRQLGLIGALLWPLAVAMTVVVFAVALWRWWRAR
jgi:hypothetical protein